MEARPAFSIERGAKQLNSMGMSSPLPVNPTPLEGTYLKLPDSQQAFVEKERMARPLTHSSHSNSSGAVGHMFSSSPGYSTDLHISSLSPHGKHSRNPHFISHSSSTMASLPLSYSSSTGPLPSTTSSCYSKESNGSWAADSLPNILDFPVNTSIKGSQVENSACNVMTTDEYGKKNEWQEWADQLINDDDDVLTSNWNDILVDPSIYDIEPKVMFPITQRNGKLLSFFY